MGYCGGTTKDPTYHTIGDHTETTEIDFDPAKTSYAKLLDVFWAGHNPCASSWSRQYMSAVFYHNDAQKKLAFETKEREEKKRGKKIETALLSFNRFYLAEDYHQKYELRGTRELMREFDLMYPDAGDFANSTAAARVNGYLAGHGGASQLKEEIDSLGLSPEGKKRLQAYVGR